MMTNGRGHRESQKLYSCIIIIMKLKIRIFKLKSKLNEFEIYIFLSNKIQLPLLFRTEFKVYLYCIQ
jgi:hypothetical protein